MTGLLRHEVQWVTAQPLWDASPAGAPKLAVPEILRFDSDKFMDDLAARLDARNGPDLSGLPAVHEIFRELVPGDPGDPEGTIRKLYQPAHGRFYLLAANLVCRLPGLPDHVVDATRQDKIFFVLRRLDENGDEEAWVAEAADPKKHAWKALSTKEAREAIDPHEDRLPMFPVNYAVAGKKRRLLVGFVPVASAETYVSADTVAAPDAEGPPYTGEGDARIAIPYAQLFGTAHPDENLEEEATRFLLLDFADLLQKKLPAVWNAISGGNAIPSSDAAFPLYSTLVGTPVEAGSSVTWAKAIGEAFAAAPQISAGGDGGVTYNLRKCTLNPSLLQARLRDALAKSTVVAPTPKLPVPKLQSPGLQTYVLRCAYVRPRCGALCKDVVSAPTDPFVLASYWDPDAPQRQVRIEMPVPSVASLRKFKKNVGFVMSTELRKKMSKIPGLDRILKGDLDSGSDFALGEICSFSLPIITLIAFIVMFIFLILLNLVFWWMPFLKICIPIPVPRKK